MAIILLGFLIFTHAQIELELLDIKVQSNTEKIETLQKEVSKVTTENNYFKKVLDLNNPITETETDNTKIKLVSAVGDKKEKTITVVVLYESKDLDKKLNSNAGILVDIEGNQYKMNYFKSINYAPELYMDVPVKSTYGFDKVASTPQFVKLFRLETRAKPKGGTYRDEYSFVYELRDFPIVWK